MEPPDRLEKGIRFGCGFVVGMRASSWLGVEFTVERSVHRGVRSGRGSDVRLCGDEMGGPVLGQPPSMVVVDLTENCREPSGNSALGILGCGSNAASAAGMGSSSWRWRRR